MPIDYKKYPANWKSEIRPDILKRAENKCEFCKVKNYDIVFRGIINKNQPTEKEVYQTGEAYVYDANNGTFLFKDYYADIWPSSGDMNQTAIKIVLTIAHLDHDIMNNDYSNLRALCQRCHNRHDVGFRKQTRDKNKLKLF